MNKARPAGSRLRRGDVTGARLLIDWLAALTVTAVALFLFFNASLFAAWNANHIDLSINLVASDALLDGAIPYGKTTLFDRAIALGSPTRFVYSQLFTSYIQPPTSALLLSPLTALSWRDATHAYLMLNHVLLAAAVIVALVTIRPALPLRWLIAGSAVIVAAFSQLYMSFALGQVDATICLLLAIGFWGYVREKPGVAGAAIACAAAIKLIPALLLLYFLWRREYRIVLWGAGVGLALLLVSFLLAGYDTYEIYLTETLPALLKGSTHYSNASIGALIARSQTPDVVGELPELIYFDEVWLGATARIVSLAISLGALAALAAVLGRQRLHGPERTTGRLLVEYYLVVAVALTISSVTWEFYTIWLLPLFLGAFLAPEQVLAGVSKALRFVFLVGLVIVFIGLNYPGDFYHHEPNSFFYHPEWAPGVWVEDRVPLYHNYLDLVTPLRLATLLLLGGLLSGLVLWRRFVGVSTPALDAPVSPEPAPTVAP